MWSSWNPQIRLDGISVYERESIGVVQWESMGMIWRGLVLALHWVCSGGNQRVWSSGCVLEGITGCSPMGVFWRESEGVVQWVCSGGNQRVRPSGCVLEGIRGCGPVGVF